MREKDCPISEKYGFRIAQLEKKYSKEGILFIYNYVGQIRAKESSESDLKKFGFTGPYFIDSKQTIINALSVKTTGEVFILTPNRQVVYRGPVDDQFHLLKSAIKPKVNYVSDMLDNIVSGGKIIPKVIPAPGCIVSRPVVKEKVFWSDVAPIIQKKCTVCHNPSSSGSINYLSYTDVSDRGNMFKYVIENDLMPPWFVHSDMVSFKNDISLTPIEKAMLLKWASTGFKKKKKTESLLKIKQEREGIKNPDYLIKLPKPNKIKATGFIPYQRFEVHTDFKEDKWIKEVEFVINPKIVHHITFDIYGKEIPIKIKNKVCQAHTISGACIFYLSLFFWVPGARKHTTFQNQGIRLPKRSKIITKIHYEPIGKEVIDDMTEIRFRFSKKTPDKQIVFLMLYDLRLKILPEESNHKNKMIYSVKEDLLISGVNTHMHFRGKASTIFITTPNNEKRTLLSIDPWNFKLQTFYWFKEPVKIPKDSLITCINWFDNSSKNVINPNPKQTVLWGRPTEDEMSICGFFILLPSSENLIRFHHWSGPRFWLPRLT